MINDQRSIMTYDKFGEHFESLLIERNIAIMDLAERVGMSHSMLRNWIMGTGHPNMLSMMIIARALGMSLDELVGFEK